MAKIDYILGIIEEKYDREISRYRKTFHNPIEEKIADEAKIRLLEEILLDCFDIETEFDFNNIY